MQAIESDFIKSECNLVFQAFWAARELRCKISLSCFSFSANHALMGHFWPDLLMVCGSAKPSFGIMKLLLGFKAVWCLSKITFYTGMSSFAVFQVFKSQWKLDFSMSHISYIPASILVCTALILIKKLQHHIEMWKKIAFSYLCTMDSNNNFNNTVQALLVNNVSCSLGNKLVIIQTNWLCLCW